MIQNVTALRFLFCLAALLGQLAASSHTCPANGSKLCQTQIMFEWDQVKGANTYEINIWAKGSSPYKKLRLKARTPHLSFLATDSLAFGESYEWQVKAWQGSTLLSAGSQYHFDVLTSPQVEANFFKTKIFSMGKQTNDLLFLDQRGIAIDKTGRPVWFLPLFTDTLSSLIIRDLEITSFGTVTYLDKYGAHEKTLDGTPYWNGPDDGRVSGYSAEGYHHDLKKHADGSYTVCGSSYPINKNGKRETDAAAIKFNTLIHYNTDGSIGWSWDEQEALLKDSLFKQIAHAKNAGHLNGFAFSQNPQYVWLSFKNYSDVWLLDTKQGKMITSLKKSVGKAAIFQQQHGPFVTKENSLLIYNNNIGDDREAEKAIRHPSIMLFSCENKFKTIKLKWECTVKSDSFPNGIAGKEGYASQTANGNFLVCTGGANYAVEFSLTKKKVWEGYFYSRMKQDTNWHPLANYRCQMASSLYPLYYTVQCIGLRNGSWQFRLHNAGSQPGNFELKFSNKLPKAQYRFVSKQLKPNESQLFSVPVEEKGQPLPCLVTPLHVTGFSKEYHFK